MKTLKRFGINVILLVAVVCLSEQTFAQSGDNKNPKAKTRVNTVGIASVIKDTGTIEELPPPPPPPAHQLEMKGVRIDTSATWQPAEAEMESRELPDTTSPPGDELTIELKKMLVLTGAINLGIQNANRSAEELKEMESGLPEGFIEHFMKELSSEGFRKIFENTVINIYRKHLTLDDVKGLNVFYQTDLGKKTLATMPSILNESVKAGQLIGAMLGEQVYNDLLKESRKN